MQDEFTDAAVTAEVRRLLEDGAAREVMKSALAQVRASLGTGGAIERAADVFARMIERP
jgi:lipid A disaccharide synthetase